MKERLAFDPVKFSVKVGVEIVIIAVAPLSFLYLVPTIVAAIVNFVLFETLTVEALTPIVPLVK